MFQSAPLVSVIVTCYNQDAYLGQAIGSVLAQTYQTWECWIVDDGSNDASAAICASYAAKDFRIKVLRQPNAGVSAARNAGFVKAAGRYIQFLDGDDWILPQKLEQQVAFMETYPQYGVCYTGHKHYWQSSANFAQYSFELLNEQPLEQLLFGYDRGVSIPIHTALMRKEIWQHGELPFPADYPHRYEDWVFWIKIALKGSRFSFLDSPLAIYRMHRENFITGAETLATHAIQATLYISRLIPDELSTEFEKSRLHFILTRYAEQKSDTNSGKPSFFKTISAIRKFSRSIIKRMSNKIFKTDALVGSTGKALRETETH